MIGHVVGVAAFQALLKGIGTVLAYIYKLVPNYGVAIILLTVAIRVILLPLGVKQIRSMQGMQVIQPKIKALQQKYKGGDRQKLNEEMMALYKTHGVNPLSGCLPLLAQFPVLIALFAVLRVPGGLVHIPVGNPATLDRRTQLYFAMMLLSILALYFYNDGGIPFLNIKGLGNPMTFSVLQYHNIGHLIPPTLQVWIFAGFFFGFAIKVPMFPFHTWLPDAHVEAPTAGSVILAAVLLKMGTYGFVRFALPILPDATQRWLPWIVALSIIGIVYGALVSLVQKDMKKLVAYSSVSHLGFVMLGMFALNPMGIKGSVLQMINHGISTGALFLLVGILYERRHTRLISEYGGLAKQMPTYATLFLIAALSSMGLPALNGFIGEFTILLGAANRSMVWAAFAALGIVLGAAYLLWLYQRVFWGPLDNPANKNLLDVNRRELITLLPLVVLMVWIGIAPKVFFDIIEEPVNYVVRKVDPQYFNRQPVSYPTVPVADHNEVAQAR